MTKIVAGLLAAASLVGTVALTAAPTVASAQPYGYGYHHRGWHHRYYRPYGYAYHHRYWRRHYYR